MKTNVYIDGFNLYFGSLKGTSSRWLDLSEMCRMMLPKNYIHKIKYFTALVNARPDDPGQPVRQQTYLRALRTIPNLSIILGHFLSNDCWMPLANPVPDGPQFAKVIKTEEKGSDVNLATHLLVDGYTSDYDIAVVITNDSDLSEPIRVVRDELDLPVGILNPHKRPSRALIKHASFVKQIRGGVLAASQFSPTLRDGIGTFHKPSVW